MSTQTTLKKAIEKAVKNGWLDILDKGFRYDGLSFKHDWITINAFSHEKEGWCYRDELNIIFSHDFAKAFWGEESYAECWYCRDGFPETDKGYEKHLKICSELFGDPYDTGHRHISDAWEYHLQQMVLEKDPIKYLKKFI